MKKVFKYLDKYNIKTYIIKLRDLNKERLILNRQLDKLKIEYKVLEKTKTEI